MTIIDLIRIYKSEWEEVSSRDFTSEECQSISEAYVVNSAYGKSVCFCIPGKGKGFIPVEPSAKVKAGDKLDVNTLKIVNLKYVGNDMNQVKKNIMRIRVPEGETDTPMKVGSFDNPFGL